MPPPQQFRVIAIDGGAASGKSSTAGALAEALDLMHVDTGAHYRTVTLALLRAHGDTPDAAEVPALLANLRLDTALEGRRGLLRVNGTAPGPDEIRSPQVNRAVSTIAALPPVRQFLFDYQRGQKDVARAHDFRGLVMEGRDIGSVIFPDADHRFFLFADESTRSQRRIDEGQVDSVGDRDRMDATRVAAPLHCPEGAVRIDTGALSLDEVVAEIRATVETPADA